MKEESDFVLWTGGTHPPLKSMMHIAFFPLVPQNVKIFPPTSLNFINSTYFRLT